MIEVDLFYFFVFFLFGLILGSFTTALIHRIPLGKNWGVSGASDVDARRSSCPKCHHHLNVKDLIPLFSWLFQRGKCRYCQASIPAIYPVTELGVALTICLVYLLCGRDINALMIMAIVPFLVALMVIDFQYKILPNQLVFIVGAIGALYAGYVFLAGDIDFRDRVDVLSNHIFGMILFAVLLWGVGKAVSYLLKKEALGFGDVKLYAVCGLWVGLTALSHMLILSGLLGVVIGGVWRMVKKDSIFPFGPAIIGALFCLIIWQNRHGGILSLIG